MISTEYMYPGEYKRIFETFAIKNYLRKEQLKVFSIEDGVVLPLKRSEPGGPLMGYGGVIDKNGDYVIESAQIGKGDTKDRFIGKYKYNNEDEIYFNETVIYIGAFPAHWGHFLVDFVYRLWYVISCEKQYKIVYCSDNMTVAGVYLEFFQLLGIQQERLLRIDKPSRFDQIIIPEAAYVACDYYTKEYYSIFRKIVNNLPFLNLKPYEKIYLSRTHFDEANQKEIGEKNLEFNFKQNGFHILYMEELSLEEQIYYISHCKEVAALSGTLCHNILFANKDVRMIILNKTHIINTHQVLINQMIGNEVVYIDVYNEPFKNYPISYGRGPFLLDSRGLKEFFKKEDMKYYDEKVSVRIINNLKYVKMCGATSAYRLYEKLYYWLCKHKIIIGELRKIKAMLDNYNR